MPILCFSHWLLKMWLAAIKEQSFWWTVPLDWSPCKWGDCLALLSFTVVLTVTHRYPSVTVEVKGWDLTGVQRASQTTVSGPHCWARGLAVKMCNFFLLVLEEQMWMPVVEGSSSWHTARASESFTPMGKTTTRLSPWNRFGEPSGNMYLARSKVVPGGFWQQGGTVSPARGGSGWLVVLTGCRCLLVHTWPWACPDLTQHVSFSFVAGWYPKCWHCCSKLFRS